METRINSEEAVTENGYDEKREILTDSASGDAEKRLGKKGCQTINNVSRTWTPSPPRSADPDTKIVDALAGIGVGNTDGWVILMSLPNEDLSRLRTMAAEGQLSRKVLEEATTAAFNPPATGVAAMDWSAVV